MASDFKKPKPKNTAFTRTKTTQFSTVKQTFKKPERTVRPESLVSERPQGAANRVQKFIRTQSQIKAQDQSTPSVKEQPQSVHTHTHTQRGFSPTVKIAGGIALQTAALAENVFYRRSTIVHFEKSASGRFSDTKITLRQATAADNLPSQKPQGLLNRIQYFKTTQMTGDVPSFGQFLEKQKPLTASGQAWKEQGEKLHRTANQAFRAGLVAENILYRKPVVIRFERTTTNSQRTPISGKQKITRTKIHLEHREKQTFDRNVHGALHRIQHFAKHNIQGDVPSLRKVIWNKTPTTTRGVIAHRTAKNLYRTMSFTGKTAFRLGLTIESSAYAVRNIAVRESVEVLRNKVRQHGVDDGTTAIFKVADGAGWVRRVSSGRKYFNTKRRELSDERLRNRDALRSMKGDFKQARKTEKPSLKQAKVKFKKQQRASAKAGVKAVFWKRTANKSKAFSAGISARLLRHRAYQSKIGIKLQKNTLKTNKIKLRYKKRIMRVKKRMFRTAKFSVAAEAAKSAGSGAWNQIRNEAGDNDFVAVADKAVQIRRRLTPTKQKQLQKKEKKVEKLKKHQTKTEGKLKHKKTKLESAQKNAKGRIHKQNIARKSRANAFQKFKKNPVKAMGNFVKQAGKKAISVVATSLSPLLPFVLLALVVILIFSLVGSGTVIAALGLFPFSDAVLTDAEARYNFDVQDLNSKVSDTAGSSKWMNATANSLLALGVPQSTINTYHLPPDNIYWGYDEANPNSAANTPNKLWNKAPTMERFDPVKFWAWFSAMNVTFDGDQPRDMTAKTYTTAQINTMVDKLFNEMYEFRHDYIEWEVTVTPDPLVVTPPPPLSVGINLQAEAPTIVSIVNGARVPVQFVAPYTATYTITSSNIRPPSDLDPIAYTNATEYVKIADDIDYANGNINFSFEITLLGGQGYIFYASTFNDFPTVNGSYVITAHTDTPAPQAYTVKHSNLYLTVVQKKTMDEAIQDLLSAKREEYYRILAGEEGLSLRGGHQILKNPLGGSLDTQTIIHSPGYCNIAWREGNAGGGVAHCTSDFGNSGLHKGIDILTTAGTPVYAPLSGKLSTATGRSITGTMTVGTETRTITVSFSNFVLSTGLGNGSNVTEGQRIGTISAPPPVHGTFGNAPNYLHIEAIENGGQINPLLVFE